MTASDAAADDAFGYAVAVDGDTIVVGAIGDDDNGTNSGSAYVYQPDGNGGYTQTKLTASDAASGDEFGVSVAVDGDTIVVGASLDDDNGTNSGSAYVYQPDANGGYTQTKLTASDGAAFAYFGWSVAVNGDTIVVGAIGDSGNESDSGAAYVYQPDGNGGYTETKLTASDGAADDHFGWSVAADGDAILVGAAFKGGIDGSWGAAYVYQPDGNGGYTETKLTASDAAANDLFGYSVAVDGDIIVVGATGGTNSGSAYMYQPDGNGGYTETKLTASDGLGSDRFGVSVAVDGDTIVVGSSFDDDNGSASGSAYMYQPDGNGGYTEGKLIASDAAAGDEFGNSVAVDGDAILVGAFLDDDNGSNSGSVYVYTATVDGDGDGLDDDVDNCPGIPNTDQANLDGDSFGDACDDDIDGDGVDNSDDVCAATRLPDEPTRGLKTNRYIAVTDGFVSTDGVVAYTLADTGGCSGAQIIEATGLGKGHSWFGITGGELKNWIETLNA
ncbi:FG-GAP repeat protein [Salsipaludibacter albus]|uniref:FG-GAP repeat protein n=1 Tax=Salsipaludibacter albus TaxID=2849650 RepID=UPI001EE41855|nr:FG-GAP repeat protein [Salsipaludibacter albus]